MPDLCSECGASFGGNDSRCGSCHGDLGAPNVRAAGSAKEREALSSRFIEARAAAQAKNRGAVFAKFESELQSSRVVVCMPASVAYDLYKDHSLAYTSYEKLVVAGAVSPKPTYHDGRRAGVAGALFGHYASEIVYGCLSVGGRGVTSYGPVTCTLKEISTSKRTSFLEENSYTFVQRFKAASESEIAPGHRAVWDNRHELALAKIGNQIEVRHTPDDLQKLLVSSDGKNRSKDQFVEAIIFGGFNGHSIEAMSVGPDITGDDAILAKMALHRYTERASVSK